MRLKQSRVKTYYLKEHRVEKDNERNAVTVYGEPIKFTGETWPAGGKVQAEQYGEHLSYIRNVKIEGNYTIRADGKGIVHYIFPGGLDVAESHGLCLYVDKDAAPDYKIISIKPYRSLRLEAEKL